MNDPLSGYIQRPCFYSCVFRFAFAIGLRRHSFLNFLSARMACVFTHLYARSLALDCKLAQCPAAYTAVRRVRLGS